MFNYYFAFSEFWFSPDDLHRIVDHRHRLIRFISISLVHICPPKYRRMLTKTQDIFRNSCKQKRKRVNREINPNGPTIYLRNEEQSETISDGSVLAKIPGSERCKV